MKPRYVGKQTIKPDFPLINLRVEPSSWTQMSNYKTPKKTKADLPEYDPLESIATQRLESSIPRHQKSKS